MEKSVSFFLLILLLAFNVSAINFYRVNIAWQYDPASPVRASHRVISEEGSTIVFLNLKTVDSVKFYDWEYFIQEGYEDENETEINPDIQVLKETKSSIFLRIDLKKVEKDLMVLKITHADYVLYYDVSLKVGLFSFPSIYPIGNNDLPILSNYISGANYSLFSDQKPFVQQYIESSFGIADPPMAEMGVLAPSAKLDVAFLYDSSSQFKDFHFYVIQEDSNSSTNITCLKTPVYFPRQRQIEELVESMLYLITEGEKKALFSSKNLKPSFDSFWLNTFGSRFNAKNAIRKYYGSVEESNRLFTDFKQGWKTDRGMIRIIFGKPDEVYRQKSLEEWYYDEGFVFEFNVISTYFSPRTYSLRRKVSFEEVWFRQISRIRRGE